eukprot:3849555-Karenia_brevis.AAC.1
MSFKAAMKHKSIVLEVAHTARSEQRMSLLGVIYDEIARKEWDEKSSRLRMAFKIDEAAGCLSEEILRRARKLHDT